MDNGIQLDRINHLIASPPGEKPLYFVRDLSCKPGVAYYHETETARQIVSGTFRTAALAAHQLLKSVAKEKAGETHG